MIPALGYCNARAFLAQCLPGRWAILARFPGLVVVVLYCRIRLSFPPCILANLSASRRYCSQCPGRTRCGAQRSCLGRRALSVGLAGLVPTLNEGFPAGRLHVKERSNGQALQYTGVGSSPFAFAFVLPGRARGGKVARYLGSIQGGRPEAVKPRADSHSNFTPCGESPIVVVRCRPRIVAAW